MDFDLNVAPSIKCNNQFVLYTYLRDASNDSQFAVSVLQVLIKEQQSAHRSRWNTDRVTKLFQVNDLVKAHVQVQYNASKGEVKKLPYQAKGYFQIKKILNGNSYLVQHYNNTSSAFRKYKGSELYLLLPSLFPNDHVDTINQRYLDFSFAPVNPSSGLNELYRWYN